MIKSKSILFSLVIFLFLTACGDLSNVPSSIAGNEYKFTITEGSGDFAKTGSYEIRFGEDDFEFREGKFFENRSDGLYGLYDYYVNDDDSATITATDTSGTGSLGRFNIRLTFTSRSEGTFIISGTPVGDQKGTFSEK